MPNALKPGMCNLPLNMTIAERAIWGRWAFAEGRSTGDFLKRLLLLGAKAVNAEEAARVEAVRVARATARSERLRLKTGGAVLVVGLFSLVGALMGGDEIRAARTFRVHITIQRKEAA